MTQEQARAIEQLARVRQAVGWIEEDARAFAQVAPAGGAVSVKLVQEQIYTAYRQALVSGGRCREIRERAKALTGEAPHIAEPAGRTWRTAQAAQWQIEQAAKALKELQAALGATEGAVGEPAERERRRVEFLELVRQHLAAALRAERELREEGLRVEE